MCHSKRCAKGVPVPLSGLWDRGIGDGLAFLGMDVLMISDWPMGNAYMIYD
jgi:hypothetical protein